MVEARDDDFAGNVVLGSELGGMGGVLNRIYNQIVQQAESMVTGQYRRSDEFRDLVTYDLQAARELSQMPIANFVEFSERFNILIEALLNAGVLRLTDSGIMEVVDLDG
jgi:hypothetical protein